MLGVDDYTMTVGDQIIYAFCGIVGVVYIITWFRRLCCMCNPVICEEEIHEDCNQL